MPYFDPSSACTGWADDYTPRMSWKVLITARTLQDVGASAVDLMRQAGLELIHPPNYGPLPADALMEQLPQVDAVLASMDKFTEKVLQSPAASQLKLISRWGVGYDAIDVPAATRHGIVVAFTPGLLNDAVADYAAAVTDYEVVDLQRYQSGRGLVTEAEALVRYHGGLRGRPGHEELVKSVVLIRQAWPGIIPPPIVFDPASVEARLGEAIALMENLR